MGEERVNQGRRGWEDKVFIKCSCVRIYYISSGLFIPFHTPMILFSFRYLFLRKGYLLSPLLFILMYPPPSPTLLFAGYLLPYSHMLGYPLDLFIYTSHIYLFILRDISPPPFSCFIITSLPLSPKKCLKELKFLNKLHLSQLYLVFFFKE